MVRWESVPRGFSACAWKLSLRLFSRPDWPPLGLQGWVNSGALARASGAPWVSKSTHPRKLVITWPCTDRPSSVRTTRTPMFTLTLSSYFGSQGSPEENWLNINAVINWQLSKQGIRWLVSPDRIACSGVDPSRSSIFLKLSADKLLVFKWSQAQV